MSALKKRKVEKALEACIRRDLLFQNPDASAPKLSSTKVLRMDGKKVSMTLEQWGEPDPNDAFRLSVGAALGNTSDGMLKVAAPLWKTFEQRCLEGEAPDLPDGTLMDDRLDEVKHDTELHRNHVATIRALQTTPARAVMITEPYGFGKTRVSVLAACCRFEGEIIVVVVNKTNYDFAAAEARHTRAHVIEWKPRNAFEPPADKTVICIVQREHTGSFAKALGPQKPAVIIADEAYRMKICGDEPGYIQNMQAMGAAAWWITDAYITAKAATRSNDNLRTTALWQQVNRFLGLANADPLPPYIPAHVMQQHVIQHRESAMDDMTGALAHTDWHKLGSLTAYTDGDEFTNERAAGLVAELSSYLTKEPAAGRRVVAMGSFKNKVYAQGGNRKAISSALQSVPGVMGFNMEAKRAVAAEVEAFNASNPGPDQIAVFLLSESTTRQITLRANVMVCLGDAITLKGLTYACRNNVAERRQSHAVYASAVARIRRYEPNPSKKYYLYAYGYDAPIKPARKRKARPAKRSPKKSKNK